MSVPTIAFLGGGAETLRLGVPANVTSALQGFSSGDVIDVEHISATSLAYANNTLTLYNGQSVVDTLTFLGHYTQPQFSIGTDGHGGTDITLSSPASSDWPHAPLEHVLIHLPAYTAL